MRCVATDGPTLGGCERGGETPLDAEGWDQMREDQQSWNEDDQQTWDDWDWEIDQGDYLARDWDQNLDTAQWEEESPDWDDCEGTPAGKRKRNKHQDDF